MLHQNLQYNLKLLDILNPNDEAGRITIIARFGHDKVETYLPKLIRKIQAEGRTVVWSCDPMHGNTILTKTGYKTRNFDTIKDEIEYFFNIHNENNTIPGGLHFELTGDNVTECIGGINNIKDDDLKQYYQTACDPRLNNEQSLEIAFLISKLIKKRKNNE